MHCFGSSHAAIVPSFHNSSSNLHEHFVRVASNTKRKNNNNKKCNHFASFVSWDFFLLLRAFLFAHWTSGSWCIGACEWKTATSNMHVRWMVEQVGTTSPPEYIPLASLKMAEKDTCIIHCLQEAHSHVRRVKNLCIWHFPRIVAIQRILATWLDACYFIGTIFFPFFLMHRHIFFFIFFSPHSLCFAVWCFVLSAITSYSWFYIRVSCCLFFFSQKMLLLCTFIRSHYMYVTLVQFQFLPFSHNKQ